MQDGSQVGKGKEGQSGWSVEGWNYEKDPEDKSMLGLSRELLKAAKKALKESGNFEYEFQLGYERREIEISEEQPYLGEVPHVRNVAPDLTCFPLKHREEALRRRRYLEGVMEGNTVLPNKESLKEKLAQVAANLEDESIPSVSTLRRWYSRFVGGSVVKLIPKHTEKGRSNVISGELEEILKNVIDEIYLQLQRHTISVVVGEYLKRVDEINALRLPTDQLSKPCSMTVRRYIAKLDPYEVDIHRIGKHAAKKKHRVAGEVLVVDGILDRWEIDHTQLDVQLVDEETGLVIGRPYITVVLDKFSRMIMGYLLHLAAPNTETVLRVIERSIRPKAAFLERFPKVQNEWRAHGLPARLVPDNAAEFHADDLIAGFNELGIEIMYPRSRGPELKGSVERFFRTQNLGLIHNLPGTTFSSIQQKGDYKSEKLASLAIYHQCSCNQQRRYAVKPPGECLCREALELGPAKPIDFVRGRFDQMIVLRHCGGSLPFGRHLKKIILDDPKLKTDESVNIYSMVVGALRLAMQDANINVPIERRRCKVQCKCKTHWSGDDERLFKMFDPKT